MTYTFDENIVSDLHKDARGYRPGQGWWDHWSYADDELKQFIWDSLCVELDESIAREKQIEQEAIADFEQEVQKYINLGAGDRTTALRWMTQTEEFYNEQCVEHWVWNKGILFTDVGKDLVKQLMNIVSFAQWEAA